MKLLKRTTQATGTSFYSPNKKALAVGTALLLASSFTSAGVIDGYQQGFEGWYSPENWVVEEDENNIDWSTPGQVTLNGEVKLSILMPAVEEFDVSGVDSWISATVGGTYDQSDALVYRSYDDRTRLGGPRENAGTWFNPGEWFAIELREGTLTLSDFEAPAATASVPEPGSLALLGLGLVGLGAARRTRR